MKAQMTPLVLLALAASTAEAQVRYDVKMLPTLGGASGIGYAVNDDGVVAGETTRTGQDYDVATVWMTSGTAIQTYELTGTGFSIARCQTINSDGVVAGQSDQMGIVPFTAQPPSTLPAMPLQFAGMRGAACSINDAGDLAGSWFNAQNPGSRPFVIRGGQFIALPTLSTGQGVAQCISNTGIIVGWSARASGSGQAAVRWINDAPVQLPSASGVTVAYGVNDEGWVVGYTSGPPTTRYEPSLWTGTDTANPTRLDLGNLNGAWQNYAYAINNHRQIVGASGGRGFIWEGGVMRDLNSLIAPGTLPSGWVISQARAISPRGLIAGEIASAGGSQTKAVLLIPRCTSADFNGDGDIGTDADIEAFFACLAGHCCPSCPPTADVNQDGDVGTDADIEAFFRVLAGGNC